MNRLAYTPSLSHAEWLEYRTKGIGGSDAAAIAGLNPWKSAFSVYMDKIGEGTEFQDNERMRIGRDLEDYVAKRFEEATGLKVRRNNYMLQNKEYPFMLANIDREFVGENVGLECKTTNSYARTDWENGIPIYYELQCHHYMAVTGYKGWWIACLIGNEKFVYKYIERDDELISDLIKIEKTFWEEHVIKREAPAPDGSSCADETIKKLYPKGADIPEIELNQFQEDIDRLDTIKGLQNDLKQEESEIKQKIQLEMKEHQKASCGDRKITWSNVTSSRIDTKRLRAEYPEITEAVTIETESRRFQIK